MTLSDETASSLVHLRVEDQARENSGDTFSSFAIQCQDKKIRQLPGMGLFEAPARNVSSIDSIKRQRQSIRWTTVQLIHRVDAATGKPARATIPAKMRLSVRPCPFSHFLRLSEWNDGHCRGCRRATVKAVRK
jgi:hypothetical protein